MPIPSPLLPADRAAPLRWRVESDLLGLLGALLGTVFGLSSAVSALSAYQRRISREGDRSRWQSVAQEVGAVFTPGAGDNHEMSLSAPPGGPALTISYSIHHGGMTSLRAAVDTPEHFLFSREEGTNDAQFEKALGETARRSLDLAASYRLTLRDRVLVGRSAGAESDTEELAALYRAARGIQEQAARFAARWRQLAATLGAPAPAEPFGALSLPLRQSQAELSITSTPAGGSIAEDRLYTVLSAPLPAEEEPFSLSRVRSLLHQSGFAEAPLGGPLARSYKLLTRQAEAHRALLDGPFGHLLHKAQPYAVVCTGRGLRVVFSGVLDDEPRLQHALDALALRMTASQGIYR